MSADRNLLFGILAVQNDFVRRDQLIEAMNAWVLARHRPLGDLLRERGALGEEEHALLEALVTRQLARHQGDAARSLAALDPSSSVRSALAAVPDADVQASLAGLATPDSGATTDHVARPAAGELRYRVLRPHARGGLGEVFVAEDTELHREVALKEIQQEHADNPGSRGRFLLEAEVTGRLEHPGIVPVYGLGSYADGRPYYAMRFIKGDNLGHAIGRFHQARTGYDTVEFRQVLRRFLDVCNAVAYAHDRGVLHRDLKPGNVMLGDYGETLLVDWGLAKVVGRAEPKEGEGTLHLSSGSGRVETVAGSAIGTPAYMSPEQAEGRLEALGPATDVYSLGATLYCLLTGRAPVAEGPLADMLEKVRRGDVVPAEQVRADVPKALAAVCAKAMRVQPGERYASAKALAQDVEHWLADEPVSAYRDPLPTRAGRWARRNRTLVTTLGAVLLVSVVGLAGGLAVVGGLNRRLESANTKLEEEKTKAQEAEDATLESYRASTNEAIENLIGSKPDLGPRERAYLEKTLARWQEFAKRTGDDERSQAVRAEGHLRVGMVWHSLGRFDEARTALDIADGMYSKLVAQSPLASHRYYRNATRMALVSLLVFQLRREQARTLLREVLADAERLHDDYPDDLDYRESLALSLLNYCIWFRDQLSVDEEESFYRRAQAHLEAANARPGTAPRSQLYLSSCLNNLGGVAAKRGNLGAAVEYLQRALVERERLAREYPNEPEHQDYAARTLTNIGLVMIDQRKADEGLRNINKAIAVRERVVAGFPGLPAYRLALAGNHQQLAHALKSLGKYPEAAATYRRAQTVVRYLTEAFPDALDYQESLAGLHDELGQLLAGVGQWPEARKESEAGLALRKKLVTAHPSVTACQIALGGGYCNFGRLVRNEGKPADSLPWFDLALRTLTPVLDKEPHNVEARQFLRNTHENRAMAFDQLKQHPEAIKDWEKAVDLSPKPEQSLFRAGRAISRLLAGQVTEAVNEVDELTKSPKGTPNEWYNFACVYAIASEKVAGKKQEYADRAMDQLQKAVKAGYNDAAHMAKDTDLDPLRARPDFKQLLADLEKKSAAAKKP